MGLRSFSEQTTCLKYKSLLKRRERSLKISNLNVARASIFQPDLQLSLFLLVSKYRFLFTVCSLFPVDLRKNKQKYHFVSLN